MVAIPLCAGLITSCSEWDDHFDNQGVEGSNTTLWEEIASRPELSDFAEVLQSTKVFRQHKKTSTSYADMLNGGQSFTVMAPVNGTFDKQSLINQTATAQGDSAVERFFVMNHITRTPHSAIDSSFRMLNNKKMTIEGNSIGGVEFQETNLRGKNGILHVVKSELPYVKTIYETLCLDGNFNLSGAAVARYNEDEFNESASVSSGLVEGVPVYVDSVVIERNKLLESIGLLNAEDSFYYAAIPSDSGWNRAWKTAKEYFKFSKALEKGDSLQTYWTTRSLLEDAVFSRTVQSSIQDSIVSKQYNRSTPEYHVFYKPFASDGIFGKADEQLACSNGTLYKYEEWPFTPQQTYFKKIVEEGESTYDLIATSECNYYTRGLNADSISKGAYLYISPLKGTSNWKVTFKISNTLAGKYDICVVTLPKTIEDPTAKVRRCKFKAAINYIDENGNAQTYDCENKSFTSVASVVDTIVVAENFKFPAANFNQNNDKVSVSIQCNITPKESSSYDREMYLDCIILRPKE